MIKFSIVAISLVSAFLLSSCEFSKKTSNKPVSTGNTSEILVVSEQRYWDSEPGNTIRAIFSREQEGLNQSEPLFRLFSITPDKLDRLLKKHRNILYITIADSIKEDKTEASNDPWASPQLVVKVNAKTPAAAVEMLKTKGESLIEMYRRVEIDRINLAFAQTEKISIKEDLNKTFGFSLRFPESFYIAVKNQEFAWMRLEAAKYSQAILIYTTPFTDSTQLDPVHLLEFRNKMTKQYVPGDVEGSYMTTDTIIKPVTRVLPFLDGKATEIRGLWRTIGDFMGGPFVSYSFVDHTSNRLITLEGYVYYPNNEKRDLLLQLEAIIHTFSYRK